MRLGSDLVYPKALNVIHFEISEKELSLSLSLSVNDALSVCGQRPKQGSVILVDKTDRLQITTTHRDTTHMLSPFLLFTCSFLFPLFFFPTKC